MNDSLPYLNSTLGLSSPLQDIFYVFVFPCVSILIMPLKLVSIGVLSVVIRKQKRIKEKVSHFFYLLVFETFDLAEAVLVLFEALVRCGSYCPFGYSYVAKIFDLIICTYYSDSEWNCVQLKKNQSIWKNNFKVKKKTDEIQS